MTRFSRPLNATTPAEPPVSKAAATDSVCDAEVPGSAPVGRYGFPDPMWRALADHPPPGLSRIRWRSPLRGPWLTSVFGAVLLVVLPIVIVTGLLSYIAYGPRFGQAIPVDVGWLKLPTFDWPTSPSWLYRLTQGLHVGLGLVVIPVVLAKLWSVIPRLFGWPPARSVAQVLERVIAADAGGRDPLRDRHRRAQHPVRLHLRVQFLHRALFRGVGVHRRRSSPTSVSSCPRWCAVCGRGQCAAFCAPRAPTRCPKSPTPTGWSPPTRIRPR